MNDEAKMRMMRILEDDSGIESTGVTKGLKKSSEDLKEIPPTVSITPFPNIDQVKSESMNLLDSSANLLHGMMKDMAQTVREEENLFKSHQSVMAAANCAKQIAATLRVKLDIYKEYRKELRK